jgi:hypothetical protein
MFHARTDLAAPSRRGIILLVVVALLTLFAIVGLSFVLYAESEAKASQANREAESGTRPDGDPELLLSYFLGQLLYDVPDPVPGNEWGAYSALRGHSLARLMYGGDDNPNSPNDRPFVGVGRIHTATNYNGAALAYNQFPFQNPFGRDDYNLVNYTYYPIDGFLRDPERLGPLDKPATQGGNGTNWYFLAPGAPPQASYRRGIGDPLGRGPYMGGAHVPYTYPDLNNMFLAAVRADGAVLLPSYHRPWVESDITDPVLMTPESFPLDPNNRYFWKWLTDNPPTTNPPLNPPYPAGSLPRPWLKYKALRPRPANNPGFPAPEDGGGDVKNLVGSPGTLFWTGGGFSFANNDSIWIDLGHPVLTAPDGRRYKPMFAPLIIDLDNRLNVNVHGNIKRAYTPTNTATQPPPIEVPTHASNQGWGPWEVSLRWVLNADTGNDDPNNPLPAKMTYWRAEWSNLFLGAPMPDPVAFNAIVPTPPLPGLTTLQHLGKYGGTPWQLPPPYAPGTVQTPPTSFVPNYPCPSYPSGGAQAPPFVPQPQARPDTNPHFYAGLDYDGCKYDRSATGMLSLASLMNTNSNCFPAKPQGYDNADPNANPNPAPALWQFRTELTDHPLLYNLFQPSAYPQPGTTPDDRYYGLTNLEALLRYGDTNAPGLSTQLFRLCPQNFADASPYQPDPANNPIVPYTTLGARRRNLLTTHSFDVDRPGVMPYTWDPTKAPFKIKFPSTTPGGGSLPAGTPQLAFPYGDTTAFPQPYIDPMTMQPQTLFENPPKTPAAPATLAVSEFNYNAGIPTAIPPMVPYAYPPSGYRGTGSRLTAFPSTFNDGTPTGTTIPLNLLNRLDLNRSLPNYPQPNGVGLIDLTNLAIQQQFRVAQQARQDFAKDIYDLLRAITGAVDPATTGLAIVAGQPGYTVANAEQFAALRWLAQLAVNIVDYIDSDDIITPFNWYNEPNPMNPAAPIPHWVFGTELPRVLINEALVAQEGLAGNMRIWVELFNPLNAVDPSLSDYGAARLESLTATPYAIYRVVVAKESPAPATGYANDFLRNVRNTSGSLNIQAGPNIVADPANPGLLPPALDLVYDSNGMGATKAIVSTFFPGAAPPAAPTNLSATGQYMLDPTTGLPTTGNNPPDPRFLLPCFNGANNSLFNGNLGGNQGYYVIGPDASIAGAGITPTLIRQELQVQSDGMTPQVTLVLQRLACPSIPPQPDPTMVGYNPYVTVDYMPGLSPTDISGTPGPDMWQSYGRTQPYAGDSSQLRMQSATVNNKPVKNTLFQRNSDTAGGVLPAFDWLIHLDRQVRNLAEVLDVSGFRPSLLTQQFWTTDLAKAAVLKFQHLAPWYDNNFGNATTINANLKSQSARIYRALEFLTTRSRALGFLAPVTHANGAIAAGPNVIIFPVDVTQPTRPPQMRGLQQSGVPWNIRVGSVVVLDQGRTDPAGNPLQENVRVKGLVSNGTSVGFTADVIMPHAVTATPDDPTGLPTITLTDLGDRVPGKVNINTIWDPETIQGLCDKQPSNNFSTANVFNLGTPTAAGMYHNLLQWRTPLLASTQAPAGALPAGTPATTLITGFDIPYRGFTPGFAGYPQVPADPLHPPDPQYPGPQYPASIPGGSPTGSNVTSTLLRPTNPSLPGQAAGTPWFDLQSGANPAASPYLRNEMLDKIAGNLTTRSNVFAVWLTVGFFEVTSAPGVQPPQLGAEIGRAENRHVRHRMFAVIDRTNLLMQQTADPATPSPGLLAAGIPSVPVLSALQPVTGVQNNAPTNLPVILPPGSKLTGVAQLQTAPPYSPTPPLTWNMGWSLQGTPFTPPGVTPPIVWGSVLVVDPGATTEEVVVVTQVNDPNLPLPNFKANFTLNHPAPPRFAVLYVPGNPGPQSRFDYHSNTAVVPYVSIIK